MWGKPISSIPDSNECQVSPVNIKNSDKFILFLAFGHFFSAWSDNCIFFTLNLFLYSVINLIAIFNKCEPMLVVMVVPQYSLSPLILILAICFFLDIDTHSSSLFYIFFLNTSNKYFLNSLPPPFWYIEIPFILFAKFILKIRSFYKK